MGYYIDVVDTKFHIPADKKADALKAVQALGKEDGGTYSWVNDNFAQQGTLKEALDAWRYTLTEDEDGNVTDITFEGQKLGDDETLFRALAPYVEAGSYLEVSGEEGAHWRWAFDGEKMVEQDAFTSFGNPLPDDVRNAISAVLNSEDNTGCTDDLTVVSKEAIEALRKCVQD